MCTAGTVDLIPLHRSRASATTGEHKTRPPATTAETVAAGDNSAPPPLQWRRPTAERPLQRPPAATTIPPATSVSATTAPAARCRPPAVARSPCGPRHRRDCRLWPLPHASNASPCLPLPSAACSRLALAAPVNGRERPCSPQSPPSFCWPPDATVRPLPGPSPPPAFPLCVGGGVDEENMEQQGAAVTAEATVDMDPGEEGRLRSFLLQLRSESGILDRMIYKNKNQHRRCPYFQSLLKVRRDVRLLLSAGLESILKSSFQVIHGKNPAQRIYHLERLKERHSSGKHNFQERLLGVARLLSQMIEPILRAAIQISSLLGRSFFMSFSLTILSLLARLRVLVQQMLVDVVSVFNTVSSLSREKHAAKLIKNGVEAFREYFPPNGEVLSLDCSWQGDKFVLVERTHVSKRKELEGDAGVASLEASGVQYETLEASDEGHETYSEKMPKDFAMEGLASPLARRHASDTSADPGGANVGDCNDQDSRASAVLPYNMRSFTTEVSSSSTQRPFDPSEARKMAAFVPVKVTSDKIQITPKKIKLDDSLGSDPLDTKETQDSFFNLLTAGSMKRSLFD